MEMLVQDLRFGFRILLRAPGITAAVIIALALGIGANSAMFSVIDAVLLHPLSYRSPEQLVLIWEKDAQGDIHGAAGANYVDYLAGAKSFSSIAAWVSQGFVLTGGDRPEQLSGGAVTANFFATLGAKPVLGRTFLPDEDGLANPTLASRVAVLSYRLWQESFGGDPHILGRYIRLNNTQYAIVGVMPRDFQFISSRHQLWIPITIDRTNRDYHYLIMVARRHESLTQCTAEMQGIMRRLEQFYPKSNKGWSIEIDSLEEWLVRGNFRKTLLLLFAAVGMVLLIACANVANLLLARSAARRREIAIRASLGAGRGRLVRQLLTESVLLAVLGGALGLGLAWLLVGAAVKLLPAFAVPPVSPIRISYSVLLFNLGVSVLTGLLFGLAPAIEASKPDLDDALKEGSRGSTAGRARQSFRKVLVVSEVAIATVLLIGASLMIESLARLTDIDLGFQPQNLLTFNVFLPISKYHDPPRVIGFYRQALDRIRALPGVTGVTAATNLPLQRLTIGVPFELDTMPPREESERPDVAYVTVSSGYVRTLGIPLRKGRAFTDADNETGPPVVLINEAFEKKYFGNENPVGRHIRLNRPVLGRNEFEPTIVAGIVGVIGNVKLSSLSAKPEPTVYAPQSQNVWSPATAIAVRSAQDPRTLVAAIRHEIREIDKEQPIDRVFTMEQIFSDFFAEPRFRTQLMGAFAGLAFALALVGIYGVSAYSIAQRQHEIGLRMALGARPVDVLRLTLGQGMRLTLLGIGAGLAGALAMNSILRSLLVGISPTDPATYGVVALLLALVALLACYLPARKAARVDPAVALRQE